MGDIKPIETEYNGYRFRSRLEARWAVFFDLMKIEYEYEPEGFNLSNGELYLPDFYLTKLKIYVEVKHSDVDFIKFQDEHTVEFDEEYSKYSVFAHDMALNDFGVWFVFGDPPNALPSLDDTSENNVLFFKGLCAPKRYPKQFHDCICNCHGKEKNMAECQFNGMIAAGAVTLISEDIVVTRNELFGVLPEVIPMGRLFEIDDKEAVKCVAEKVQNMTAAAIKARQARFEHGEKPFIL